MVAIISGFAVAVNAFVYRTTVYVMLYGCEEQQATDIVMRLAVLWSPALVGDMCLWSRCTYIGV